MEITNIHNSSLSSSFHHPLTLSSSLSLIGDTTATPTFPTSHQPSRKKRTKFLRVTTAAAATSSAGFITKPKPARKPDPTAPKITRPCTECGKKFWSWKALFGHMRCHPERQWRGINPPANLRRPDTTMDEDSSSVWTEDDHDVAACLLMLSNGPVISSDQSPSVTTACTVNQGMSPEYSNPAGEDDQNMGDGVGGRFECSSCKKVFGSHQALGGHRASHKNVKGCYAITKSVDGEEEGCYSLEEMMMMNNTNNVVSNNCVGHKCSICFRVFSSGQALGGHMRCHWEKAEEEIRQPSLRVSGLDLNLAAPIVQDDDVSSLYPSGLTLDLRLGL